MKFDIIGDIHGYADELEILLRKLGYNINSGVYEHPDNRKAIFLGDFIDRGPKIRETLHIIKNMCDRNKAFAIMGNHEFNAVCYHTFNTRKGEFYRNHDKMIKDRHFETINQFEKFPDEWSMFLNWFKNLPLYLDFEVFRVIHAYWNEEYILWIKQHYTSLTNDFIELATTEGTIEYNIIEDSLKGVEVCLQNDAYFMDIHGIWRKECRLKWWQPANKRKLLKDILINCPCESDETLLTNNDAISYESGIPVFFGHYWLEGEPRIENPYAICLDYSVANKGKLISYKSEYLNSGNLEEGFIY